MKQVWVVKVSGNELSDERFLSALAEALKEIRAEHPVVLVHGGGKDIAELHHRLGVQYEIVEGLRATSAEGIRLVEMALSGVVNTRLVRTLVHHGIPAQGISGVDAGLIRVTPRQVSGRSLGFVGKIHRVDPKPLERMLKSGILPVVSPVSLGPEGESYNVNADEAAQAIAAALSAQTLVFLTNVSGILDGNGRILQQVEAEQVESLISEGVISGGMIPKARSAAAAVKAGVSTVLITDLEGLRSGSGTSVSHARPRERRYPRRSGIGKVFSPRRSLRTRRKTKVSKRIGESSESATKLPPAVRLADSPVR